MVSNSLTTRQLIQEVPENPWVDGYKVVVEKHEGPLIFWKGSKLPFDLFAKAVSYTMWANKKHRSEALVQFYSDGKKWAALAPPQNGNGLTVKAMPGESFDRQRQMLGNMQLVGDLHSHCDAAAGQSGVDRADETPKDGFYITVGKLSGGWLDTHVRIVMEGYQEPAHLGNVVELEVALDDGGPGTFTLNPGPSEGYREYGFPDQWEKNYVHGYIKTPQIPGRQPHRNNQHHKVVSSGIYSRLRPEHKGELQLFQLSEKILIDLLPSEKWFMVGMMSGVLAMESLLADEMSLPLKVNKKNAAVSVLAEMGAIGALSKKGVEVFVDKEKRTLTKKGQRLLTSMLATIKKMFNDTPLLVEMDIELGWDVDEVQDLVDQAADMEMGAPEAAVKELEDDDKNNGAEDDDALAAWRDYHAIK